MEEKRPSYLEQITSVDWEKTLFLCPETGRGDGAANRKLRKTIGGSSHSPRTAIRESQSDIQEFIISLSVQTQQDSRRSRKKTIIYKKRGGQAGHNGHSRDLYPSEKCSEVIEHHPITCHSCGESLSGEDKNPYRHQIVEIPPIEPIVIEHRLHQLTCGRCGTETRATLPPEVNPSGYGVRVVATVALLSVVYRNSQRMVQSALADLFGISMSLGTVNKLRQEASVAVANCVDEAKLYVQQQKVVGADETSFKQGNLDGCNSKKSQAWLWVAVTPLVTFFQIALSRSSDAARNLRS